MPDGPAFDVIESGRDGGRRGPGRGRLLGGLAAALIAVGIGAHLVLGGSGRPARHPARRSPSSVALTGPAIFHGTPLAPGLARPARLFLGGDELRVLNVGERASAALTTIWSGAVPARDALGSDPAVQQLAAVAGGVVALVSSPGSAGLPDIGDVLFIPVSPSGTGAPRVIARANFMAVAPGDRRIWVEQGGPPWGNGPADSPAWLIDEAGRQVSGARDLGHRVLVAATVRGLLVQGPARSLTLIDPANGHAAPSGVPQYAIIAGADEDHVAWQAPSCPARCPLHITDLRGGPGTEITLPPDSVVDPNDSANFDPAGRQFALPLDILDRFGVAAGTYVYVADIAARTLVRVPGGQIPDAELPAVSGAFPAGSTDVVSADWAAGDSGLWIVATDGLFFQAAYWAGSGPPYVLRPQTGLAYKFAVPGTPGP